MRFSVSILNSEQWIPGTKIKVAVAGETLGSGGLGHYMTCIDRALREHAPPLHEIVTPRFECNIRPPAFAGVRQSRLYRKFANVAKKAIRRRPWQNSSEWVAKWKSQPDDVIALLPHVVFLDNGDLDSYYEAIAARPFVWVIHDLLGYHYPEQWKAKDIELMHRRFELLRNTACHVITQNNFTAEDVHAKLGIPRERITAARQSCLVPEWPSGSKSDDEVLGGLELTRPYAVWCSSSTFGHKNHDRLLRAWRLLLDRGHNIQLVITGSKEPRFAALSALSRELGLAAHVRFTGIMEDADLGIVMRNAHLAVCPTLFEGGGSGPASEAILTGLPLAVSSIPVMREQFDDRGDLCSFFDPYSPQSMADAVEGILNGYEAAKRRAEYAKIEMAGLRSWRSIAESYWSAIDAAAAYASTSGARTGQNNPEQTR